MTRLLSLVTTLLLALLTPSCTLVMHPRQADAPTADTASVHYEDPVLNQRRILLFGNITETTARETIEKLLYLDSRQVAPIDLVLMTPGGDLKAAFAIENAFHLIRSPVNTCALAECNSSGAMLLAAGTGERTAFRGAMIVIHGIQVRGKPPRDYVDGTQSYYTSFWQSRTRPPPDWLPIAPNSLHAVSAEQALEFGLIDRILDRPVLRGQTITLD